MINRRRLFNWCAVLSLTALFQGLHAQEQRIVSLAPSLTESLCSLGLESQLVGVTSFCSRPESVASIEKVASAVDVNVEKTLLLRPTLVVTTKLTDIKDVRKLQALGLNVEIFDQPRDFETLCRQVRRLGRLTKHESAADSLIRDAKRRLESLASLPDGQTKPKVLIQIGADPLFVATDQSLMNDMIIRAGGVNVAGDWGVGLASREKVLAMDPELVVIVTMGVAGSDEQKVWQSYKTLTAARNKAVFVVDAYLFCSPTPDGFAKATEVLAEKIIMAGEKGADGY